MFFKVVIIFLLVMVLVGMVGKLLFPSPRAADRCPSCGRPMIGKTCNCKGKT